MVDVLERPWKKIKYPAGLLGGFGETGRPFNVSLLYLGLWEGEGFPLKPVWPLLVAAESWLGVCCWLILPAKFLLEEKNSVVYMLQRVRFLFLQGILVGNWSHLIQSIPNVIIKIYLISTLDGWGDNSLFFETVLCLLKTILPMLHKCRIAARPY